MAFTGKFLFEGLKVLYNTVMNHGNAAGTINVWMCVSRGGDPVGSPARMTNPYAGVIGLIYNSFKVTDLSFNLRDVNFSAVKRGYSCRVITSIPVSYTHLRAHETRHDLVCRLLLEKKK